MTSITLTAESIQSRLARYKRQPVQNNYPEDLFDRPPRQAAVLVPFTWFEDAWHILLIRRPDNEGDRHGGQVAFPGGGREPEDRDLMVTALRETHEEVGIRPQDVEILGQLDVFHSISNYLVTPVIGRYPSPYTLTIEPAEVARAFTIPYKWLANPSNHRHERRVFEDGKSWPVTYFDTYDGELLWGFSAQVMLRLLDALALNEKETDK